MKKLIATIVLSLVVGLLAFSAPVAADTSSQDLPWEIEHKVRPGEHLFMLAGYYYGDSTKWELIYEQNMDKIKNPKRIYPKQVLTIKLPRNWEPRMSYDLWYQKTAGDIGPVPKTMKTQGSLVDEDEPEDKPGYKKVDEKEEDEASDT